MIKEEQKKAIEQFSGKKYILAVLPTGYGESLIFHASCVAPEKSWKLCIAWISLFRIINDKIMEVKAMI